jgi:hypothetical protein
VTQSVQSLKSHNNLLVSEQQQMRQLAASAQASNTANTYNFKTAQPANNNNKRHPSMNSDKSHGSSVKSAYSSN